MVLHSGGQSGGGSEDKVVEGLISTGLPRLVIYKRTHNFILKPCLYIFYNMAKRKSFLRIINGKCFLFHLRDLNRYKTRDKLVVQPEQTTFPIRVQKM